MSTPEAVAAVLCAGATFYAIFGGADFGAGLWRLLVRGHDPAAESRRLRIDRSIGPVWEANHVWLIFALVVLWTGFPVAFAAIMKTLYVPLALAALGIVLRGSAFAFQGAFEGVPRGRLGVLFGLSSILTPFFMGTVVGAVAAGEVAVDVPAGAFEAWTGPLPLMIGAIFVASGAYLAAVFLIFDSEAAGEAANAEHFRRCALLAAVVAGGFAVAGLVVVDSEAPLISDALDAEALPLLAVSALAGLGALAAIWLRRVSLARPSAVIAVVAVVAGWAVAQHPYLLPETLTIEDGAAGPATLDALLIVAAAAALTVVPALLLLFFLAQRRALE